MRISLNIVRIFKSHSLSATNVGNEFWWENDKVYIVCHILSSLLLLSFYEIMKLIKS